MKKAKINVVIRIRPLLPREVNQGDTSSLIALDESNSLVKQLLCSIRRIMPTKNKQGRDYSFDKVLGPDATQEMVFTECNIPLLLDRTIEGYHATLFAYGQTGVGKTYTMEGYDYSLDKQKGYPKPIVKVIINNKYRSRINLA